MRTTPYEPEAGARLNRRDFLRLGLGALGSVALVELSGIGLLYMQPQALVGEFGGLVTAGAVDSFPPASVTPFPDGRFFLIRAADGGFLAVYSRCPHLGCTVSWESQQDQFVCPCHASRFDNLGSVENPPAPRALDLFAVSISDGLLQVDTTRPSTRDHFAPTQLTYAA
jgi:nitrite reductase/ring-hydroxylating ferredoxin subunit